MSIASLVVAASSESAKAQRTTACLATPQPKQRKPAATPSPLASRIEQISAAEVRARQALYDDAPMRGGVGSQSRLCAKVTEKHLAKHSGHQKHSGQAASGKAKRLTGQSGGGGGKPQKSSTAAVAEKAVVANVGGKRPRATSTEALAEKAFVASGGGKRPRPMSMTRGAVTSRAYERTLKQATDEGEGLEDAKKFAKRAYAEAAQEWDKTRASNLD